jgi:hypothetical protein
VAHAAVGAGLEETEGAGAVQVEDSRWRSLSWHGDRRQVQHGIDVLQVGGQDALLRQIADAEVDTGVAVRLAHVDASDPKPRSHEVSTDGGPDAPGAAGDEDAPGRGIRHALKFT